MLYELNDTMPGRKVISPLPLLDFSNLPLDHLLGLLFENVDLMPIFWGSQPDEEADFYALNRFGDLVIFELTRSIESAEGHHRVINHSHQAYRWTFDYLQARYNAYCKANDKAPKPLEEIHQKTFGLENPLLPLQFNAKQHLFLFANAEDDHLLEVIKSIDYLQGQDETTALIPYRIYDIDVGIARFATMSDAESIAPLNSFKKHQQRLSRYQRRMSRKVKFSSNWKKAKAKVQKIHTDIANARKDFLHKTTTVISKNHALVCIEDLQVRNMSKSSKGNREQHGKRVRQKTGLNRAILDQGWGEFRRQLEYKMIWNGGVLLAVPPHNTSRTCPCCYHISKENRLTQAEFLCVSCGYENYADVVGAINILERGHRLLACGELAQSGLSAKQEPIEVTQALVA